MPLSLIAMLIGVVLAISGLVTGEDRLLSTSLIFIAIGFIILTLERK
jgi:hypothetical protein